MGGSGTTAAGVTAGVPTIITPVFLDQFDYAKAVNTKGIGRGLKALVKVTAEEVGAAITQCCTDEGIIAKAREMGEATSKRNGVAASIEILRTFYDKKVSTGQWAKDFQEEYEACKP